jgi:hypothetical protein
MRDHEGVRVRVSSHFSTLSRIERSTPDALVAVEGGHHIGRGHGLAVVELDALAQLERVGQAVRRLVHALGEVE